MMNMQCQFRACSCRLAEEAGVRFVHDHAYDHKVRDRTISKGLKRKAEDDLPIPTYTTLRGSFEQKSRARDEESCTNSVTQAIQSNMAGQTSSTMSHQEDEPLLQEQQIVSSLFSEPDDTLRAHLQNDTLKAYLPAGVIPLEQAADIPLPSPRSDDLEPTALLEDMTQVMVEPEPAATENHFAFSTSVSSRKMFEDEPTTPVTQHAYNADLPKSTDDLFDVRPPRHLPPRPSTVMGLRTIASPIRMVPPSPEHRNSLTPHGSPPSYRTMQIPLKDSPLKNTITHRRSNSKPPERTRARSPTPGRGNLEVHSPSVDTFFPVTPKQKGENPTRPLIGTQISSNASIKTLASQSTTNTIPLRGGDDDEEGFVVPAMHDKFSRSHVSHTELTRGRQPLHPNDPNTHSHAHSQSQSIALPGTPITREAALAQIRARRDRARSVAMRKQADEENSHNRIKTPKSAARRGIVLNRDGMARDISNLSQASAPARF